MNNGVEYPPGRRRVLPRGQRGALSEPAWRSILKNYGRRCLRCHAEGVPLTKDHVQPRCRGGSNRPDNMQPLCAACNTWKGARWIDFRPDLGEWARAEFTPVVNGPSPFQEKQNARGDRRLDEAIGIEEDTPFTRRLRRRYARSLSQRPKQGRDDHPGGHHQAK